MALFIKKLTLHEQLIRLWGVRAFGPTVSARAY